MSKHHIKTIAALCAIAGLLGSTTARANQDAKSQEIHQPTAAQSGSAQSADSTMASASGAINGQVRLASQDSQAKKFDELKGKKVTGSDGETLGKVHDFVIDTQTGKIARAVISSGGALGIGDKLRVIQHDSLKESGDGLTAQVDPSSEPDGATQEGDNFVRASELSGKELRAGNEAIGEIETVAIDLQQGTAMAVVKVSSDTAGADDMFHVPFNCLQIDSAEADTVSTTLARTDFTQAQSSSQTASAGSTTSSTMQSSQTGETYGPTASTQSSPTIPPDESALSGSQTASSASAGSSTSRGDSAWDSASTRSASDSGGASGKSTGTYGSASSTPSSSTVSPYDPASTAGSASSGSVTSSPSATSSGIAGTDTTTSAATSGSSSVAGTGSASTTDPSSTTAEEEQLTPTGREQGNPHYALGSAAAAIRSMLSNDETLASEDVRVQEAGRKIMLQGKVSSEEAKTRIESLARQAAGSTEVESKLKVEKQE